MDGRTPDRRSRSIAWRRREGCLFANRHLLVGDPVAQPHRRDQLDTVLAVSFALEAQGVGTVGSDIIKGSRGVIPVGDGPYLSLTETGGSSPGRIHNVRTAHPQRPSAQIAVRAKSYRDARTMIDAAYVALDGVFNTTLSGVFYQKITAKQEPQDVGLDVKERPLLVFNIDVEKQPS